MSNRTYKAAPRISRGNRRRTRSGPSPAESLLPQIRERAARRRSSIDDNIIRAPSKLIGYVLTGSFKPAEERRVQAPRSPRGRALVAVLVLLGFAIWLGFGGWEALFG